MIENVLIDNNSITHEARRNLVLILNKSKRGRGPWGQLGQLMKDLIWIIGQLISSSPPPSTLYAKAVGSSPVCPKIKPAGGLLLHTRWVTTPAESSAWGWGCRWIKAEPELTWNFQVHSKRREGRRTIEPLVCRTNLAVGQPEVRVLTQILQKWTVNQVMYNNQQGWGALRT